MKKNICLLMTGCITPPKDIYALHVKEPDIRKAQYLEALKFYIEKTNVKKIVFCDNSNTEEVKDITETALKNGKEFEWLSFSGNVQKMLEKGKGFGEGELLEHVCKNSRLIQTCQYMVKVTGRLKIKNLNSILRMAREKNNYINIFINKKGRYYADTRFFIIAISDFKKYLMYESEKVDDRHGMALEFCYAEKIVNSGMRYKRIPTYIEYEGISGSTGLRYTLSLKEKVYLATKIFSQSVFGKSEVYNSMELYQMGMVLDDDIWDTKFGKLSGKNIAIYGAGEWGQRLYKLCVKHCNIIIWIDKDYKKIKKRCGKKIKSPDAIKVLQVDYIVIAVNSSYVSCEINKSLKSYGVESEILWFDGYELTVCG